MQDFTRNLINTGDDIGGVSGAMFIDPIGTMASGKYSNDDILDSSWKHPIDFATTAINKIKDKCFITTAVCEYLGESDDCYTLRTLRNFRDGWLREHHPEDIDTYYAEAPSIVAAIKARTDAYTVFHSFYRDYLASAVRQIEQGQFNLAYETYRMLFEQAKSFVETGKE